MKDKNENLPMWPTPRAGESYQGDGAADAYAKAGFKQPRERNGKRRKSSTFDTTLATAVIASEKFNQEHEGCKRNEVN